ncbi:MAG TPA: cytochrome c biogenesis protein ResB [Verrucomicrobiae bacterium]|nr:cytochrome c biogenesis protein ResB [Verrucomicrobiae bacterium]
MYLDRLIRFFSSLRLTVVCLALGMIIIFAGTFAQVELGLYKAQNEFFRSFLVYWTPHGTSWKIPVLPGGYLVGGVLLINLVSAHFSRFRFSQKKVGIWMIHAGLILMLLGQLLTDMLSNESTMHLREGEAKNYSESDRVAELVVADTSDADSDTVAAINQSALSRRSEFTIPGLPLTIRVRHYFMNSTVANRGADAAEPAAATQNIGARAVVKELPRVTAMDQRDVPSAVVEVMTPQGSLGTWLVSEYIDRPQTFVWNNRTYEIALRSERHYKPYTVQLLNFTHDLYKGTDIPKNFASRVLLQRPDTGERREARIYMNNPLRYAGETYYQASYDKDDHGSVFQVVRNPSWLTPYLSCVLVGLGLIIQFMSHLVPFVRRSPA